MYEQIYNEMKNIMIDELGTDENIIMPEASLVNDLNINSLEFMNLIMTVEEKFDITLDENRLKSINTVDDVVNYIIELK